MSFISGIKRRINKILKRPAPKLDVYVQAVAARQNIPYEKALEAMDHALEAYDISYLEYAQEKMETLDEAGLEEVARKKRRARIRTIKKIMALTGWTKSYTKAEVARVENKFNINITNYYISQYFLMTDDEIAEDIAEQERIKQERIARLLEKSGWTKKQLSKHMKECRMRYSLSDSDYELFKAWECSFEELDTFSTLRTTKALAHKYNKGATKYIADKRLFNETFKEYINRRFWVNEPDATYESFEGFIEGLDTLFCKPINLTQGRGTSKIQLCEWDPKELYDHFMSQPLLLIEECVKQHHLMNELYDKAVNTVRIITIRYQGEIRVISSFLRMGLNGGIVDNLHGGGAIAGVDELTGEVITGAVDEMSNTYEVHPNSGTRIRGFMIPNYDLAREIAIKCMDVVEGTGYIGWDIAICEDKAVIIEGNTLPGLASYQTPFCQEPVKKGMLYKFVEYL